MNVLDLFSGIGGFSLGLERAGMRTVAFCEIEPYCQRVLAKHWPDVHIFDDVRYLTREALRRERILAIDVICGGFPCQDISVAGKGAGIGGERSGLWKEYARIIGELRPRFVIVENVAALLGRGMGVVLGDLAALGYDAEWQIISAADVGAPHRRERVWIVAYPNGAGRGQTGLHNPGDSQTHCEWTRDWASYGGAALADNDGRRREQLGRKESCSQSAEGAIHWAKCFRGDGFRRGEWLSEPDVGRVANGIPARVDRLRGLGNAVVPQIPELIGRAIMQAEGLARG